MEEGKKQNGNVKRNKEMGRGRKIEVGKKKWRRGRKKIERGRKKCQREEKNGGEEK